MSMRYFIVLLIGMILGGTLVSWANGDAQATMSVSSIGQGRMMVSTSTPTSPVGLYVAIGMLATSTAALGGLALLYRKDYKGLDEKHRKLLNRRGNEKGKSQVVPQYQSPVTRSAGISAYPFELRD